LKEVVFDERDLLDFCDAISREKSVDLEVVFAAVEAALASASKKLHGGEVDIRVSIDRESGEYETFRRWHVVPNEAGLQLPTPRSCCSKRRSRFSDIEVDDYIEESVESVSIGRIGAQAAKQVILRRFATPSANSCSPTSSRAARRYSSAPSSASTGRHIVESGRIEGRLRRSEMIRRKTCAPATGCVPTSPRSTRPCAAADPAVAQRAGFS